MEVLVIAVLVLVVIFLFFVVKSKNRLLENNEIVFHKKESILTNKLTQKEVSEKELLNSISQLQEQITELQTKTNNFSDKNNSLQEEISKLQLHIDELSKYQTILDANEYASQILAKARDEVYIILTSANQEYETNTKAAAKLYDDAKKETKDLRDNVKSEYEITLNRGETILKNAALESRTIIEKATKKAEEIAGEAYQIKLNADKYESIVKAMKNIIEGYGDQYLIPTYSLLDDLAEEFGYTEAGQKLSLAREYSKMMVKNGTAAKCDYVEKHRRETAIQFVLDAFNGKVDSILSKVKKDNYGTLQQKINDAFEIVNMNGTAFRNAVITTEFLNSRLEELKWAIVAQELKWKEQEEQRRIKEQLREEERARREYEKAIQEAQKNEETLKKLIEKAQREIEQANEEQKLKYEEQLNNLEQKLKEAEEISCRGLPFRRGSCENCMASRKRKPLQQRYFIINTPFCKSNKQLLKIPR